MTQTNNSLFPSCNRWGNWISIKKGIHHLLEKPWRTFPWRNAGNSSWRRRKWKVGAQQYRNSTSTLNQVKYWRINSCFSINRLRTRYFMCLYLLLIILQKQFYTELWSMLLWRKNVWKKRGICIVPVTFSHGYSFATLNQVQVYITILKVTII